MSLAQHVPVADLPPQPPRFRLMAYIMEHGAVEIRHDLGADTLHHIFVAAPLDTRYFVVEVPPNFWLVDVLDVMQAVGSTNDPSSPRFYVNRRREFPTVEAAIMAGVLL